MSGTDPDTRCVEVFTKVDDLLNDGMFAQCNQLLSSIDPQTEHPDVLLAWMMSVAVVPKELLPAYPAFFAGTRKRLSLAWGIKDAAEILVRFEG